MIDSLACALVKLLGAVLCALPPAAAVWLGGCAGTMASWLQAKRTRTGLLNLRAALDGQLSPAEGRRIIRRCYQQLGAGVFELLRLPVIDRAYLNRYIIVDGVERLASAAVSGRPIILLTGHLGNWELSSIVAALLGYPIVVLARAQEKLPKLYRLLVSYRQSKGCRVVHKGGAMRRLIAALEQRQMVGIVADQASRQGLAVDFFGRPALFATGPFALAHSKQALILPAFIHRLRGPFHRLAIERPFELPADQPEAQAVRQGIERFAALLAEQITRQPAQWLWMHKRWKHTAARRVLVLSDGKAGHVKQSLAVVELLRRRCPQLSSHTVEIRYRSRFARGAALLWSRLAPAGWAGEQCLRWTLAPTSASALLARYADVVVSCGASVAPVNVLWAADNRARSVVLMNPSPLPLRRFDLVIAPRHDRLPRRRNVVEIAGAMTAALSLQQQQESVSRLQRHPKFRRNQTLAGQEPVIALLVGGETDDYLLTEEWMAAMIEQILRACEAANGVCLATTSRRTPASAERLLADRLGAHPRCLLALLASRDAINGTMEGLLGSADVVVATGESISMVSEARASGRPVVVVELPRRTARLPRETKHARFLRDLSKEGAVHVVPIAEVSRTIHRLLGAGRCLAPLDQTAVGEALARLL
ncbi:MAG: mitochondrial fission ELM1 family protein, partial [Candidatus Omnitrophica bacterium]|nr:mitochondrial fission ELM1 family protein [Candidatus Omnitrophota bacterium]